MYIAKPVKKIAEIVMNPNWDKIELLAGGFLLGTAGLKILGSKDAKKLYTHSTAAVLRAKDCTMTAVTKVRENADDILSDAKELNERRAAEDAAAVIEETEISDEAEAKTEAE